MKKSVLLIEAKKDAVFITLNRPEKRNALTPQLIGELLSFFKEKKWNPKTKALVLKGAGKAFCAGADLKWMADDRLFTDRELKKLFLLLEAIDSCPLPVVALVQGFAVGGGLGLLAVSDIVIAESKTRFLFSETKLGLVPSIISPFVLKKIGLSHSRFFMLSALSFSADEARQIGLAHFTGSKKECGVFLKKLLKNFENVHIPALSQTKKWLNTLYTSPAPPALPNKLKEQCVRIISKARKTAPARQKIKKLLNK